MSPKYDASKLLYTKTENNRFWHKLNISEQDERLLLDARREARKAIRMAFHEAKHILLEKFEEHNTLHQKSFALGEKREFAEITPAFWPQGSYSYRTMNIPAYAPPQQFDLDDGVYLPVSMFEDEPIYSKSLFFEIVDSALSKLADSKIGWEFINDKDTCSRIKISDTMHLDFPLYAMPKDRFEELKKSRQMILDTSLNYYKFSEDAAPIELDPNDVYLAMRSIEHWVKSDPKRIETWFKNEVDFFGRRLRRVCRYLKAWRDHTWVEGGPSSIVLMVCVVDVFNKTSLNRDCEALLAVAKELPQLFGNKDGIINPAVPEDEEEMFLSRHKKPGEIEDIISKSKELYSSLNQGLVHASSAQEVVDEFIASFGCRIPNNSNLVLQLTSTAPSGKSKKQKRPFVPANIESGYNIETG